MSGQKLRSIGSPRRRSVGEKRPPLIEIQKDRRHRATGGRRMGMAEAERPHASGGEVVAGQSGSTPTTTWESSN